MQRKTPAKFNEQIYQEACEWFVEFRSGDLDASSRRRFDDWARKSPEHLAAYLEVATLWSEESTRDSSLKWDTETLIAQAAAETATGVVPLPKPHGFARRQTRPKNSTTWPLRIAVSMSAVGLIIGALVWYRDVRMPVYATAFGEQRSITLADGSVIDINSHSTIRVRYSAQERDVDLLQGQALFRVAKNPARPFIVSTAATQVRAVGTEFDVYKKIGGTVITVVEGRVAVDAVGVDPATVSSRENTDPRRPPNTAGASILVSAGEQLLVTPKATRKTDRPNIAVATSWTQRQLQFESASLSEVAEEFNRYNERQLIIEDPTLYDFHITGVFSSSDPSSLVRFLRERPGVRVTETAGEIRVTKNIL